MPHIWIEYSANLASDLDLPHAMKTLQDAAIDDGSVFPLAGARTRAVRVDDYRIVDGHPDNAFIHVLLKVGHGRSSDERKVLAERTFAALQTLTAPIMQRRPLGLSLQVEEADPILNLKANNYREHLAKRTGASSISDT